MLKYYIVNASFIDKTNNVHGLQKLCNSYKEALDLKSTCEELLGHRYIYYEIETVRVLKRDIIKEEQLKIEC